MDDFESGNDFLDRTPEEISMKGRVDKLDFTNIKNI
jgi:hypothetical protein